MFEPPKPDYTHEACEGCHELLDVTNFAPFETVVCPHCSVETHVKRNFGAYRLEQKYAVGGMSVIFEGRDTTLDRRVAIKVLNEDYCNDEVRVQAFENEARLTAQVSHPNVVNVYAVGRAYGRFYLVMELLEGSSFENIMAKRGALPEKEVLEIATQVASGLKAAKHAGMIHRDVKPGNILLDSDGNAKLVDFGLALITQDGSAQAQEIWATPYYVPPEALHGGQEDFRSDIYAFGATLYHALAGRPPFETTSTSGAFLMNAKQTIPRLCQVATWVSPATGEIIDRMMAFNPEERWDSYDSLIVALDSAILNVEKAPAPQPIHSQVRQERRKRSPKKIILMAAAATLSLIAILMIWQPWSSSQPTTTSTAPSTNSTPKPPSFNPDGGDNPDLREEWETSRTLLGAGAYDMAQKSFLLLANKDKIPMQNRAWACLEATSAALLNGEPGKARKLAKELHMRLHDEENLSEISQDILSTANKLQKISLPRQSRPLPESKTVTQAMAAFTTALKLWEQGDYKNSLPYFANARAITLAPSQKWFKHYQNIADTYLSDATVMREIIKLDQPANFKEAKEQLNLIRRKEPKIKTKGRARYHLKVKKQDLRRSFPNL